MSFPPNDAWVFGRLLIGKDCSGELASVSEPWRPLAVFLNGTKPRQRNLAWQGAIVLRPDRDALIVAVADQDPLGPPPVPGSRRLTAHLGDLAAFQSTGRFIWKSWLVRGHFNLFSSDPKIGKTYVTLDLARRMHFALLWPDGQPPTFPAGTKTLWICGDRHQDELREYAASFGLPPEALLLNASPDEPYGGWDLDDRDNVDALRDRVQAEKPGLVIIDTVWRATRRRLSREDEVNLLMDPLITMAQDCDMAILGLMHLSKDNETLGRRLEGLARGILKLFKPDPDQPNRRRLEVSGNFKEPPPLGVTLRDGGCDFDSKPPEEAAKNPGGRPAAGREAACRFIRDALAAQNDLIGNDLFIECEKKAGVSRQTFWRAVDDMKDAGELTTEGGRGLGKQMVLHLSVQNPPAP